MLRVQYLPGSSCLWAVGQGALAVECLAADVETQRVLQSLTHGPTLLAVVAERALMAALQGGCSAPVGVTSKVREAQGSRANVTTLFFLY